MNDRIISLKQILIIKSILSYGTASIQLLNFVYFSSPDGSTWLLAQFKEFFVVSLGCEKSYYISFSYYNFCFLQILSVGIILIYIYINEW